MKINNLICHIATGEEDNSFVGIKILGNSIHFYYPESYCFDQNNYERDDFIDLLKTISIAKRMSSNIAETYNSRNEFNDRALLSYIWILEDYVKNGFFISFERTLKTNKGGRVVWKKTLQNQPIISGKNLIYSDLITEVKSSQETVLVEAYKYCVNKSISMIGWLYGMDTKVSEVLIDVKETKLQYLESIQLELNNTNNDEKNIRLIHMKNVLLGLDEVIEGDNIIYGVDNYNYIFEKMIDHIFSTENVEDYYPKYSWKLKYSREEGCSHGATIRPDTIMKDKSKDNIYIIDSKFYRYGSLDLSKTKGLPDASSIVKQITYGRYVSELNPNNQIYNVFILPYNSKSQNANIVKGQDKTLVYVGKVFLSSKRKKTYETIHTFLIDLKYVIKTYNSMYHNKDKKKLVDLIDQNLSI